MTFPHEPQPQVVRKIHWPWTIVISLATLGLGIGIGLLLPSPSGSTVTASPQVVAPPTAPNVLAPAVPRQSAESSASGGDVSNRTVWGDGLWIVGVDIEPGIYRSPGAKKGFFELCMVTLRKGASSNVESVEFPIMASADEPIVIEVTADTKAVDINGCEPLTKIG